MNEENETLEANTSHDETFTKTEETTEETELEAESDDSGGDDSVTLSRAELEARERAIRKDQDKRWKERLKGQKGGEGGQESTQPEEGVATKEEMDRFRLETKGVEDKAAQDFILKYAKLEGISVAEAMKDEIVQAKLSKLTADGEKARATQSPVNRTGRPREKTPEELARLAEKGQLPATKEERRAVRAYLQQKYGRT